MGKNYSISKILFKLALALALAIAFILRIWGIEAGLPYVSIHIDEGALIYTALSLVPLKGVLWLIGPGLFMPDYLLILYGIYFAAGKLFGIFTTPESFYIAYLQDPTSLYLIGRFVSVLFGVASVWFTYKIASRWFNTRIGLIAAWFLATAFLHVKESHYIKGDVLAGLLAIFLFHFSCQIAYNGKRRDYIISGILTGIAFGVKYFSVIPFVMVLAGHIYYTRKNKQRIFNTNIFFFIITSISAVFFQSPMTFINRQNAISEFIYWGKLVHKGDSVSSVPVFSIFLFDYLRQGIGTPMFTAFIIGSVYSYLNIKKIQYLLLILFPLFFLISVEFWARYNLPRYAIILFPSVVIIASIGINTLIETFIHNRLKTVMLTIIILMIMAPTALRAVRFNHYFTGLDTRYMAKTWIEKNVPNGSKVVVAGMLKPYVPGGAAPILLSQKAIKREIQKTYLMGGPAIGLKAAEKANNGKNSYDIYVTLRLDRKNNFDTGESSLFEDTSFYQKEGYLYLVSSNWTENPSLDNKFIKSLNSNYEKIIEFKPSIDFTADPHIQQIEYAKVDRLELFPREPLIVGPRVAIFKLKNN